MLIKVENAKELGWKPEGQGLEDTLKAFSKGQP
jgi:hypothetical protein